jgi:tRNA G18 (ribose-2'-O)-methylase SpoU
MVNQIRNKTPLTIQNTSLTVACPVMKSNVNISMIVRSASCFGVEKIIITGNNTVNNHIARDYDICIEHHNTLLPVIKKYKRNGYKIIGLEQTNNSNNLYDYSFSDIPTLLIIGNECKGIIQEILDCLDDVIEIPLYGKPSSLNVGMATTIVLFEYSKQINKSPKNLIKS